MKTSLILVSMFLLSGCLGMAEYEEYWEPVQKETGVSLSQALSSCNAEASAAAAAASANASSNVTSGGGFAGGFASSFNKGIAGPLARRGAMNSCMASNGFRKQKMCVANC